MQLVVCFFRAPPSKLFCSPKAVVNLACGLSPNKPLFQSLVPPSAVCVCKAAPPNPPAPRLWVGGHNWTKRIHTSAIKFEFIEKNSTFLLLFKNTLSMKVLYSYELSFSSSNFGLNRSRGCCIQYSRRCQLHPKNGCSGSDILLFWKHGPLFLMNGFILLG